MSNKILLVPPDVNLDQLGDYVLGTGGIPERSYEMPMDEYMAIGRAADCTCNLIQCVCDAVRPHAPDCRYRVAMACAVPIDCEHGNDVCATCDTCTCGVG